MHNIPTALWIFSLAAMAGCFVKAINDVINEGRLFEKTVALIVAAICMVYFFVLVRL